MTPVQPQSPPYVSPLNRLAFFSMLLFLFLLHSRLMDLTFPFLHVPVLSLWVAVGACFLGGGFLRAFSTRIGILLLLLSCWMVMCVPFSVWPGGAARTLKDWIKTMLVFAVIAGLIKTYGQFRQTVFLLAISVLALALLTIPFGSMAEGRLALPRGRFKNPNDLAQIMLMGLPFWWFIATNRMLSRPRRLAGWLSMALVFMIMAKTGSRGALIAFAAVAFVLFWRSSVSHKVSIMVGAMALVVLASMLLPKATKDRYFTFLADDEVADGTALENRVQASAVSSTWGRWGLLQDSVTLTLFHPLFGVGAGQFVVAQDQYSWAVRHHKGAWHVTHNTYTEVSSENGIPALLFFLLALYFTFRGARVPKALQAPGKRRPKYDEVSSVSFCLRLSLLAYVISGMFGSFAYATQFPVLAALAVAFGGTAAFEASRRRVPEQPLPLPVPRPVLNVPKSAQIA